MKKGQEEIVGFVVVVVLIAVVALIFLGFSLRSEPTTRESVTIDQFLSSSLEFTSDCTDNGRAASVKDLMNLCRQEVVCQEGSESCEVLNKTMSELIYYGLRFGEDNVYKGYTFKASYNAFNTSIQVQGEEIIEINAGNCTGRETVQGSSELHPRAGGVVRSSLSVCS